MRHIVLFLCFAFQISAFGYDLQLAWDPSPDPTVTGFNVYYGTATGVYTNMVTVGLETSVTITGLVSGPTYYFAVTAFDAAGAESELSNEVSYEIPLLQPSVIDVSVPFLMTDGTTNVVSIFRATIAAEQMDTMRFWKLTPSNVLTSTDLFSWESCFTFPTNAIPGVIRILKL